MEKRILGKTGLDVSILGFGGAEIGYEGASQADVERLLSSALDAGLNTIDTAECYADSEEKIGKAVAKRREEFHLFTKCGHASGIDLPDWDPKLLEQSIDRSLSRLQVEHVDLVQLHSCSEDLLRQGDVIAVLQKARDAGKARFIGYSGDHNAALYAIECGAFDTLQTSVSIADQECVLTLPKAKEANMGVIAEAIALGDGVGDHGHVRLGLGQRQEDTFLVGDAGKARFIGYSGDHNAALYAIQCGAFDTLQTSVSIADQECVFLTLPKAKEANMGVIAKRPIANVAWRSGDQAPENSYIQTYWERLQKLAYDFLGTDKAVEMALRFTLSQPAVCTAIVGTTKPNRWQQNAELLKEGNLPQAQIHAIRARWQEVSEKNWVGQG